METTHAIENAQFTTGFIRELEMEYTSTKKCLERIPESLYEYKPHPTSMSMYYVTMLVAEIPLWIALMFEKGEIDFETYKHAEPKTNQEMLNHFEDNFQHAKRVLLQANDENLQGKFELKRKGKVLTSEILKDSITSAINHWVHHRGQLTVYMRMNGIAVPSIYGPSADDKSF